jgi:uncharacterized protein YecE (DUF72 family)
MARRRDVTAAAGAGAIDGIRTGIGGWVYAPWRGVFYPEGLPQRRELEHASRHLSVIEVNGTWYGMQKPATYARWRDETPPGFVFSAKAPRRITHARALDRTGPQVEDFVGGIATLGDRLGPLVWQFDAGARVDHDGLEAFLALLPRKAGRRRLRHVLDMRVPALVDADLVTLARSHGVATVFTDSREHPSFADVTAGFVYARLMRAQARLARGYRAPDLARWAARARAWAAGGEPDDLPRLGPPAPPAPARDVFMLFIGAAKARNPAAAMALHDQLVRSSPR